MSSIWETAELPSFPPLRGDVRTEVLIIGGGAAGLLTAYYLHRSGVPYVLAERERICSGVTRNTTAKITAQHGFIYQKLIKKGIEPAEKYLRANLDALEAYGKLCKEIPCDFQRRDNYVYSVGDVEKIRKELEALGRLRYPATLAGTDAIPVNTVGAVRFPEQAQFSPLRLFGALAKDLHIYEHTCVRELVGTTAVTDGGRIHAKKVIVATHFPFLNKHGSYFLKLYQFRSYVIALKNAPDVGGMYVDGENGGLSFRNSGEYLLLGGGGARTGKPCGGWDMLRSFANLHYPDSAPAFTWATQDCMSLDGVPYIGQYAKTTPELYVATGFNKWGMTGAMAAATVLCDRIMGKENPYADLFDPSRSILHTQLAKNGAEAAVNLLTFSKKRCPHLGCALKWNPREHSWDCPCHGSRFAEDGRLLNNPATGDLPNQGKAE